VQSCLGLPHACIATCACPQLVLAPHAPTPPPS